MPGAGQAYPAGQPLQAVAFPRENQPIAQATGVAAGVKQEKPGAQGEHDAAEALAAVVPSGQRYGDSAPTQPFTLPAPAVSGAHLCGQALPGGQALQDDDPGGANVPAAQEVGDAIAALEHENPAGQVEQMLDPAAGNVPEGQSV